MHETEAASPCLRGCRRKHVRLPPPIAPQGKRSSEHLENMQRLFPGVHGRVIELCKPSQKKYNAAVTIAMGKNMDAIVVDNEATAQDCIRYLKEKKGAPETFVPLETIRATPIAERMRQLGGSKRPVIDVISINDERFLRAVQYAVGDALVCDSLDEVRARLTMPYERPSSLAHHYLAYLARRGEVVSTLARHGAGSATG